MEAHPRTRETLGTGAGETIKSRAIDLGNVVVGRDIMVNYVQPSLDRLANADPKDVQEVASAQLQLLTGYYEVVLTQAKRSFDWALIGVGIGLSFFVLATSYTIWTGNAVTATIPVIAGAVVEAISGIVFWLYSRTADQLSSFHRRLELLQRHLLANSICESLGENTKDATRAELIREMMKGETAKDNAPS